MPFSSELRVRGRGDVHKGDQLVIDRGPYKHHMIVTEDPVNLREVSVIHYTTDRVPCVKGISSCCGMLGKPIVRADVKDISSYVRGEILYRIDYDEYFFSPDEIVERAESKLGERKYSPFTNNCEHFATWCKTGSHESAQGDALSSQVGSVVTRQALIEGTEAAKVEILKLIEKLVIKLATMPEMAMQAGLESLKKVLLKQMTSNIPPSNLLLIEITEALKRGGFWYDWFYLEQLYARAMHLAMKETAKTTVNEGIMSVLREGARQTVDDVFISNQGAFITVSNRLAINKIMHLPAMKETAQTAMNEGAKSVAGEWANQVAKEGGKTVVKETAKTAVKEGAKSVAGEGAKQVAREGTKTIMEETAKTAVKEGTKSVAGEGAKQAAREGGKTVVKETAKTAVKEGTKSVAGEGAKQVAREGGKTVMKETSKTAVNVGAKSAAREGAKQVAKSGGKSFGNKIMESQGTLGIALTVGVETYDFINRTRKSKEKLDNGEISQNEFEKQVATHVVKGVASGTATVVGGTLGQTVIPVPVIGSMFGAMLGKAVVCVGGLALGQLTG